jgi:hypothetical protein
MRLRVRVLAAVRALAAVPRLEAMVTGLRPKARRRGVTPPMRASSRAWMTPQLSLSWYTMQ